MFKFEIGSQILKNKKLSNNYITISFLKNSFRKILIRKLLSIWFIIFQGNCWFISAVATLASIPNYCRFVIPANQTFDKATYAGIFHFRFWQFGEWVDVVVDDRLPVDENNELIYCHNENDKNEFFGPLLEKAYAKLAACYEFLNAGDPEDAMTDLSGAVCETFDLKKCLEITENEDEEDDDEDAEEFDDENADNQALDLDSLWELILRSFTMKSLMNSSLNSKEDDVINEDGELPTGLVPDHAYSVLQVAEFKSPDGGKKADKIKLIKLRNPYGNLKAWKGAWSVNSRKWRDLSSKIKSKHKLSLNPEGEFYISFDDFIQFFDELSIGIPERIIKNQKSLLYTGK